VHPLVNAQKEFETMKKDEIISEYHKATLSTSIVLIYYMMVSASSSFMGAKSAQKDRSISQIHSQEFLRKHTNFIGVFSVLWLSYLTNMYF
jgi:hypothetical protein